MDKLNTTTPYRDAGNISADAANNQLQRILSSPEFTATESQRKILDFVVLETLAGNSAEINGFTVATRVLGRGDDFDQALNPIVSIHANKLRLALERYYLVIGYNDPVWIEIPKGGYVPLFISHSTAKTGHPKVQRAPQTIPTESSWPTLLIRSSGYST